MDRKLRRNFIYNFITQLITVLTPLIISPYISRVLNVDLIGDYNYCYSIVTVFGLFANMGISVYGIPAIAKYKDSIEKRSKVFMELMIIKLAFSLFISIFYLLFIIFIAEQAYKIYFIIFGMYILSVFFDITWFFQGLENFKTVCFRTVFIKILSLISIFLFVKNKDDMNLYIVINMVSALLPNFVLLLLAKKYIIIKKYSFDIRSHFKPIFNLFLPAIAYSLYGMLDKTMIKIITGGTTEVGFYEQAYKIAFIGVTVISVFATVLSSRISSMKNDNDIRDVHKFSYCIVVSIGIPILIGLFLLADYFIPFYYGKGYEGSINILKIFSGLTFIVGISNFVSYQYFIPKLITKPSIIVIFCSIALNAILNVFFIKIWGGFGAALATVVAELFISISYMIFYSKFQKMSIVWNCVYKYFISGIITFVIVGAILKILPCTSFLLFLIYIFLILLVFVSIILILKDSIALKALSFVKNKIRRIKNA